MNNLNKFSGMPPELPDAKFIKGLSEKNKHISSVELLPNFYMCFSFRLEDSNNPESIKNTITFEYLNKEENVLVSYEPYFGPIQIFYGCSENEGRDENNMQNLHHLLGPYYDQSWTQLMVQETGLNEAVLNNDLGKVRDILLSLSSKSK